MRLAVSPRAMPRAASLPFEPARWRAAFAAVLSVVAAQQLLGSDTANAADAFLCDGGRVVYVELADLERMKRTDACIAGYFGIAIDQPDAAPAASAGKLTDAAAAASAARSGQGAKPARQAQPRTSAEAATSASHTAARRAAPGRSPATAAGVPPLPVRTVAVTRAAGGVPVVAAPATDYRNVRVINAGSESQQWFHHGF